MSIGIGVVALFAIGGIAWMVYRFVAIPNATAPSEPAPPRFAEFPPLALNHPGSSEVKSVESVDTLPEIVPEALLDSTVVVLESADGTMIDPLELKFDDGCQS